MCFNNNCHSSTLNWKKNKDKPLKNKFDEMYKMGITIIEFFEIFHVEGWWYKGHEQWKWKHIVQ